MAVQVSTNGRCEVHGNPMNSVFSGIDRRTVLSQFGVSARGGHPRRYSLLPRFEDVKADFLDRDAERRLHASAFLVRRAVPELVCFAYAFRRQRRLPSIAVDASRLRCRKWYRGACRRRWRACTGSASRLSRWRWQPPPGSHVPGSRRRTHHSRDRCQGRLPSIRRR
jgi:hypothetical protein